MAFTTITDAEREDKGVSQLPDSPQITPVQLKELFDSLGNLAIDKFILHITEISDTTGAANIGAKVPEGYSAVQNVQAIIDAFAAALSNVKTSSHTHANKDTLDGITDTTKQGYDSLVSMFTGIMAIANTLADSSSQIPNSHAVMKGLQDAISSAGYVKPLDLLDAVFPVGTCYSTALSSFSPSSAFGGSWDEVTFSGDASGLIHYIRRA